MKGHGSIEVADLGIDPERVSESSRLDWPPTGTGQAEVTMSEIQRIEDQLKRSFETGAWHGPAVLELLEDVSATQAAARPIAAGHSIWEIVLHMTTWKSVVARRVSGEVVNQVPDDVDWPPAKPGGETEWAAARQGLQSAHAQLLQALRALREDQLDQPPYAKASSRYVQLHGIIQHDLYHGGQIAVLKKG